MKKIISLLMIAAILLIAGIAPNLFVIAQAGMASFHFLILDILLPSVVVLLIILAAGRFLGDKVIVSLTVNGILAGLIATIGLELFRETGFRLGTMPGDLPRLMGVVMLDQFASGPDVWSDLAGWAYHFWNGAAFGIIFSLVMGKPKIWHGAVYGFLIGLGFMVTPVVKSLGIGLFGLEFKNGYQFAMTVSIAHIAFGLLLAASLSRWNKNYPSLINFIKALP
jgi:hypothetical protein